MRDSRAGRPSGPSRSSRETAGTCCRRAWTCCSAKTPPACGASFSRRRAASTPPEKMPQERHYFMMACATAWRRCGAAAYTSPMKQVLRSLLLFAASALAAPALSQSQEDAILLVAHPAFRDLEYRQTVLIAAPAPNGGHVGVILNRPTKRSLASLFPEHEPSKKVMDPVFYGGPFSRGALVAIVKAGDTPGEGTVQLMKNLYMAFRVNTIDQVIESQPNDARYYVGYVGWR